MALHTFDVTAFRVQFPQFSNPIDYPDAILQIDWDQATCYINPNDFQFMTGDCLQLTLNLMTAHLAAFATLVAQGQNPGFVESATIDRITVGILKPAIKPTRQWQSFLSATPYGARLLALLQSMAVGGFYVGGLPESGAVRKVGGIF